MTAERISALKSFISISDGYLEKPALAPAKALIARGGERLALSQSHTVVALAGSTGAGKSSIFNQLAGLSLSEVGLRRPTTGDTHACVWGPDDAGALLDWLEVARRFRDEAAGNADLNGLVLLDLPDFDSVQKGHRAEVDRLLAVVDLMVWVLHPQKYADKVVHHSYLSRFSKYREITVVVLNQADLLSEPDLHECTIHLRQLLAEDGMADVPLLTASTVGPPGLDRLIEILAAKVEEKQAAVRRLRADLDVVTTDLEAYIGPAAPREVLDRPETSRLTESLSRAAGVPVVAAATEKAYVHRARKFTGWPPLRWLRRFRPDPLRRLHLDDRSESAPATSISPASPAAQAGVSLAIRAAAAHAGRSLPDPWPAALLTAMRSNSDDLPDALDRAVAETDLGLSRPRFWWRLVNVLQWLATFAAAAGLAWLGVRYLLFALALPEPPMPEIGRLPLPTALLAGGLLTGLLLALASRLIVRLAARHRRRRAEARLRAAIARVADALVLTPARKVMSVYSNAREALRAARP